MTEQVAPTGALLEIYVALHPHHGDERQDLVARLVSRLGLAGIVVPADTGAARVTALRSIAAPAAVIRQNEDPHVVVGRDLAAIRRRRAEYETDGRGESRVSVELPVAIGRTRNEAVARADRDPRFRGAAHPEQSGIFGTFEHAQVQVLDLASAGATRLLVVLADELDVSDLLAQVRALVVGATPALLATHVPSDA